MSQLLLHPNGITNGSAGPRLRTGVATVAGIAVLCVAYYLATLLGYLLAFPPLYVSVMWPPNTLLLAALLLSPFRHWPWLLLILYPVHLLGQASHEVSALDATLSYAFDCVLVVTTARALRYFGLQSLALGDLREALVFIIVVTVATAVGSLLGSPLVISHWVDGGVWQAWGYVCLSNLLPFLIALPCLLTIVTRGTQIIRNTSPVRFVEFALLNLGLIAVGMGVFGLQATLAGHPPALAYAPLPFLLWAAVRFGPSGLSFSFVTFSLIAISYTLAGEGPLVAHPGGGVVLSLQTFLLALYVPKLVLASLIEERRAKGVALAEGEARYRGIVEDQTELICRFLPDGTYTFVNGAYCRYFQRTPEELLGKTFWSLIPEDFHPTSRAFLAKITPEHPVATIEHEVLVPGGEIRWQQWRDRGFFDAHGRLVDYQAVGRDITDRKRAEHAMQNIAHSARLAVVGELTGSIAHEINQPLGAILSNAEAAEMLLDTEAPPMDEVRNILADIRKDDLRASEVIRRVRGLLRKREPLIVALDLNDVVDEVVRLVAADARQRKVELAWEFAPGLPRVRGDRVRLQQVLLNLIINGLDAMHGTPEPQRRLVVRTEPDAQGARVCVTDVGHGIPPDKLSTVFESFFTTKEHGMGLGLSIARSIVDLHGGRIWATNNPTGGATLSFTLPLSEVEMATEEFRGAV